VREHRWGNQKRGQSRETGNTGYTSRRKTQYVLDTTILKQTQI